MQHLQNNLILHLVPTAHKKQNKQYGDKFIYVRRLVNDCYHALSDFLFGVVKFLEAGTSLAHKIMRSLAIMAVVLKISCLNSIQAYRLLASGLGQHQMKDENNNEVYKQARSQRVDWLAKLKRIILTIDKLKKLKRLPVN